MSFEILSIKRVYEAPGKDDGTRILVDRIWPRGVSKQAAQIDQWMKELAPSTELRKWFDHDPEKWDEFRKRYQKELEGKPELLEALVGTAKKEKVTLVYGAKDTEHNNAVALVEMLKEL